MQKWLSSDLLAKIDFIAFSGRFGDTILKNVWVQIFLTLRDLLLLWRRKALSNKLSMAITEVTIV